MPANDVYCILFYFILFLPAPADRRNFFLSVMLLMFFVLFFVLFLNALCLALSGGFVLVLLESFCGRRVLFVVSLFFSFCDWFAVW